jgi:hypothetical protein
VHLADEPASNGPDGFPFLFGDTREMTVDPVVPLCGKVGRPFAHRVAIHEAGHVIAGYMLLSVIGATIEFVGGHHGRVWADEAALDPLVESIESICAQLAPLMAGALDSEIDEAHGHVIQHLAGIEAERLFYGETLPNTAHDIKAARDVAALIVREGSVDAYIEFCRRETRALLLNHAAAVLAIADALIRHRTINRIQIASIMKASG